jgi:hypothetical protein
MLKNQVANTSSFEQVNTTLQFKTQKELLDAIKELQSMFVFSVYNSGKQHQIGFRTEADANKAASMLKEQLSEKTPSTIA